MNFPVRASFVERATGAKASGFIRPTAFADVTGWLGWHYRVDDEDSDWNWPQMFLECALSDGRYECYSAFARRELQGLMVLDMVGRRVGDSRGIVVDYLATNPVNRTPTGGLKYIGVAMIGVALARSVECGRAGRLWLESLPGARDFYESLGMARRSRRSKAGHFVYTLSAAQGQELLAEIKRKQIVEA